MGSHQFPQACLPDLIIRELGSALNASLGSRVADGMLKEIHLESGQAIARSAIFFTTGCHQSSNLSATLGCIRDEKVVSLLIPSPRKAACQVSMLLETLPVMCCWSPSPLQKVPRREWRSIERY